MPPRCPTRSSKKIPRNTMKGDIDNAAPATGLKITSNEELDEIWLANTTKQTHDPVWASTNRVKRFAISGPMNGK